jgi:hypothetical protein
LGFGSIGIWDLVVVFEILLQEEIHRENTPYTINGHYLKEEA